jgi:asparagine synthase (glutamine-hydrolysing)
LPILKRIMCGITGIFAFNLVGKFNKIHVTRATEALKRRGPDFQDVYLEEWVALGHRRLSIIDTSAISNQPMWDETGRYCIVFNGEIFNYQSLRRELQARGVTFFSSGDTEVLLKLFIHEKEKCLSRLNGFFSFCIYDKHEQSFFLARDRFGIKPLLYVFDENKFLFASEMKSILEYGIERSLDHSALLTYLQLNYIPAPHTIFPSVKKLLPGQYMKVTRHDLHVQPYYSIPYTGASHTAPLAYEQAKEQLYHLLDAAVQRRLVADVPLGAFLSGGIDSSVITALAKKHKPDLHTFSIGYRDEKFFDETQYARSVARHLQTEHTVFSLTNQDLYEHLYDILDALDEPFADSSAIAVYILSKETRKHSVVALSGDGADELFAGYNKHAAFYRMHHRGWKEQLVKHLHPVWKIMPRSRGNRMMNMFRQLARFSEGMRLNAKDRYWQWASFCTETDALRLLNTDVMSIPLQEYKDRKAFCLQHIPEQENLNDLLLNDMHLVLSNDMLIKVDLMSMANALEVRVPFLDYEVVNFAFTLPVEYKIDHTIRKRILQDSFRSLLPPELYNRPKKGFEVPLLKWFKSEMKSLILDDLLSEKLIRQQQIFNWDEIKTLRTRLFSGNPGDVHARIWGLIVFQWWWKKHVR